MLLASAGVRIFRVRLDRDWGTGSDFPQLRAGTTCRVVLLDQYYLYVVMVFQRKIKREVMVFQRKIIRISDGVSAWTTLPNHRSLWTPPSAPLAA